MAFSNQFNETIFLKKLLPKALMNLLSREDIQLGQDWYHYFTNHKEIPNLTEYLRLLIFYAQTGKLGGPFTVPPHKAPLRKIPDGMTGIDIANFYSENNLKGLSWNVENIGELDIQKAEKPQWYRTPNLEELNNITDSLYLDIFEKLKDDPKLADDLFRVSHQEVEVICGDTTIRSRYGLNKGSPDQTSVKSRDNPECAEANVMSIYMPSGSLSTQSSDTFREINVSKPKEKGSNETLFHDIITKTPDINNQWVEPHKIDLNKEGNLKCDAPNAKVEEGGPCIEEDNDTRISQLIFGKMLFGEDKKMSDQASYNSAENGPEAEYYDRGNQLEIIRDDDDDNTGAEDENKDGEDLMWLSMKES